MSLNQEFEHRAKEIFERALSLPEEQRADFVRRYCRDQVQLAEEVLELLGIHHDQPEFLTTPAVSEISSSLAEAVKFTGDAEFQSGDRIGPYTIEKLLGVGGMGEVYLASQSVPMCRQVALKIIKLGMDTQRVVARFERERETLALMNHHGIARILDAGATEDGRPFLAMEYLPGTPITTWCEQRDAPLEQKLRLVIDLCDAVQHAHQKGVIHRDLKPSNVLVTEENGKAVPKIIDFGIARLAQDSEQDTPRMTQMGFSLGTPEYMAPEQRLGSGDDIDTRADGYAVGVILYELLTGVLPRATNESDRFPAPSQIVSKKYATALRGDLDWIVIKALDEDRERRYANVSEIALDLERHLRNEPVSAGAPSRLYLLSKLLRKHRVSAGILLVTITLLVIALVSSIASLWNAREAERREREAREQANLRLREVTRFSNLGRLQFLKDQADSLWPAHPSRIAAMQSWIEQAEELLAQLPDYRLRLTQEDHAQPGGGAREIFATLVQELQTWEDPDAPDNLLADLRERLRFAQQVEQRSFVAAKTEWDEAINSIRDPKQCPHYRGLVLEPQLGLVPLGQDPKSKLWEFAHLQTGEVPWQDPDGNVVMEADSGLVFVLLPPGTFAMGAVRSPRDAPDGVACVDPFADRDEGPIHTVTLEPFFLSKYEMTWGQWNRIAGRESASLRQWPQLDDELEWLYPIESITWFDCKHWLGRLDLQLPTEAQWEYACRARTTTPWYTGKQLPSLSYVANLAGREAVSGPGMNPSTDHADEHRRLATIGYYPPNPFGLHGHPRKCLGVV